MLVATAGHIDHGKTSLVRALTGVETDRLPEERKRGISIDLGFAYWRPDAGETVGFVDVPGHEKFVRNMLAGVGGVDLALLVVAADDGVMPQTVEHAQILDLMGAPRGAVAITKTDRVPPARIAEVRDQVRALLARTALADAPVFEVSAVTGAGIAELGDALRAARAGRPPREAKDRAFRLAVDRAFSVTGAGTVVTGTVLDGAIEVGARLVLSPCGAEVRVRGLQSAGQPVQQVQAGDRAALNLVGLERAEVRRGDWLVAPAQHAPTTRVTARVQVLADAPGPLKHNATVHLHHGTADLGARLHNPGQAAIAPGSAAVVDLALDPATRAVAGDRFVLRDPSGRRTLAGGVVIDPFAPARRRPNDHRETVQAALQANTPDQALAALLAIPGHEVDITRFERTFNLPPEAAERLYAEAGAVRIGANPTLALPAARLASLRAEVVAVLEASHQADPQAEGLPVRDLAARLREPASPEAVQAVIKSLAEAREVAWTGVLLKRAGHVGGLSAADAAVWGRIVPWLQERGFAPFTAQDLARETRGSEVLMKALLSRKRATGEVWRMDAERWLLGEHVAALLARADLLGQSGDGTGFSAAQFRDATGIGRNTVIRLLEFFDTIGVTTRRGDLRKVRAHFERVVGSAEPFFRD
jgi:selenocysteine-specific elongation factor